MNDRKKKECKQCEFWVGRCLSLLSDNRPHTEYPCRDFHKRITELSKEGEKDGKE